MVILLRRLSLALVLIAVGILEAGCGRPELTPGQADALNRLYTSGHVAFRLMSVDVEVLPGGVIDFTTRGGVVQRAPTDAEPTAVVPLACAPARLTFPDRLSATFEPEAMTTQQGTEIQADRTISAELVEMELSESLWCAVAQVVVPDGGPGKLRIRAVLLSDDFLTRAAFLLPIRNRAGLVNVSVTLPERSQFNDDASIRLLAENRREPLIVVPAALSEGNLRGVVSQSASTGPLWDLSTVRYRLPSPAWIRYVKWGATAVSAVAGGIVLAVLVVPIRRHRLEHWIRRRFLRRLAQLRASVARADASSEDEIIEVYRDEKEALVREYKAQRSWVRNVNSLVALYRMVKRPLLRIVCAALFAAAIGLAMAYMLAQAPPVQEAGSTPLPAPILGEMTLDLDASDTTNRMVTVVMEFYAVSEMARSAPESSVVFWTSGREVEFQAFEVVTPAGIKTELSRKRASAPLPTTAANVASFRAAIEPPGFPTVQAFDPYLVATELGKIIRINATLRGSVRTSDRWRGLHTYPFDTTTVTVPLQFQNGTLFRWIKVRGPKDQAIDVRVDREHLATRPMGADVLAAPPRADFRVPLPMGTPLTVRVVAERSTLEWLMWGIVTPIGLAIAGACAGFLHARGSALLPILDGLGVTALTASVLRLFQRQHPELPEMFAADGPTLFHVATLGGCIVGLLLMGVCLYVFRPVQTSGWR